MVVVDQLLLSPAEQRHHLARHPLATGIGVAAREVHELPVGVPHRRRHVEQGLLLGNALAPGAILPQRQEPVRHPKAEAARAEVHADPHVVRLVGEHVHVVVAAAHGAELVARLGAQPFPLVLARQRVPRRIREQRVVAGRVAGAVLPSHAERDRILNGVGQLGESRSQPRRGQVGADRGVAARDVEPDSHHGHLVAVRGHAADRHDVPEVPIGHERRALGPARHVAQLGQRLRLVGPENLRLGHTPLSYALAGRGGLSS